jgi:hypothetical protein
VWPVRISDVYWRDREPEVVLQDEAALRAWVERAAQQPAGFYELVVARNAALRFALGREGAGGILEVPSEVHSWCLQEGDPALPAFSIPADGDLLPVPGAEQVSVPRLTEVLVAYAREGERPPGRWMDERGRPEPPQPRPWDGPPPRARGPSTSALIEQITRGGRRAEPLQEVLTLMRQTRDDDLRAYLYAYAHHEGADQASRGDWWPAEPRLRGRDVQIGILASGEPVVARRLGGVELVAPDGWLRSHFEDFLFHLELSDGQG